MSAEPRILPCGDAALLVEFGNEIDPELNAKVLALDARLNARRDGVLSAVVECVPTYRSLLVHYDPVGADFAALARRLPASRTICPMSPRRGGCGASLSSMAALSARSRRASRRVTALSPAQLIETHAGAHLSRLHDRLRAGLCLSRRARSGLGDAAPRGAAHAGSGGHDLDRRHPGARRLDRGAERLAPSRAHAGAHLHARARPGLPHRGRRPGAVRADRRVEMGGASTGPPPPASRSPR